MATPPYNFMQQYRRYTTGNESDPRYHVWAGLSIAAAKIGRNLYHTFGHQTIYPNLYVLLVGVPASRKSTALTIGRELIATTGYNTFAMEKTSREKFLLDFEEGFDIVTAIGQQVQKKGLLDSLLDQPTTKIDMLAMLNMPANLMARPKEVYLSLSEFCDFMGQNNSNFATTLTTLYDNLPVYQERLKNSKSVNIPNPTVNLFGGLTPSHFDTHFPPELIGQGFMSRVILVYGKKTDKRVTRPPIKNPEVESELSLHLEKVGKLKGEMKFSDGAEIALDKIYQSYHDIPDVRFQYYCARRLTHLIKVCMVVSALKLEKTISIDSLTEANTYLVGTEVDMPRTLGEYGEGKYSKVSQRIIETLNSNNNVMSMPELFKAVRQDVDNMRIFEEVLRTLAAAHQIQVKASNVMLSLSEHSKNVIYVDFRKYFPEALSGDELI